MLIRPILIAVFVLVACTFVALFRAGERRDVRAFPDLLDVLFYVLVALLIETRHADLIELILACVYVLMRVILMFDLHGRVQAGARTIDLVALVVLAAMWVVYALEVFLLI
jgi:hypothetical protein